MGRFQNNPSIGWLHPKSTHAHPLVWANKKLTCKPITLSIWPTLDSPTPISAQKVFPHCLCRTEPTKGEEEEGTKNEGKNRHYHENIRIMSTNYQQQMRVWTNWKVEATRE